MVEVQKRMNLINVLTGSYKREQINVGLNHRILQFTLVDERLVTIFIRAKFFNILLICPNAPMKEKGDVAKYPF